VVGGRRGTIAGVDDERVASTNGRRLEGIDGTGSDLSRLLSLSDGVFAFALTFLAVSLLLPQVTGNSGLPPLGSYLGKLETAFIGYVISFFVIAAWWNVHHRLFSCIVRYDQVVVRLNSFFLLMISVTPFLVSLLFAYSPDGFGPGSESSRLAVIIYALVQAVGGCDLLVLWRHATRERRLVVSTLTEEWIRTTEQNELLTVGVFGASVGIAFASPLLAELAWIVMIFGIGRHLWRRPRGSRSAPGPGSTR